ncbi:MAG: amidohydrolase family protein [Ktedonobacteraceae bacterium]|nr:amidohydrolase family protein [Ktedonobacteraceae bacterium]
MQLSPVSSPIIDIHRHVANPRLMTNLASIPREVFIEQRDAQNKAPSNQPPEFSDIDAQVQDQDQAGVTKGVLSNPFPLADLRPHAGGVARDIAVIVNDDLATVVAKHPGKLDFLATVHPFEPGFAEEADRSLTRLGAKGLTLTTSYAGRWLDDRTLGPFWEYVQSRDTAIFLHPPITPTWLPLSDVYPMQEMLYRPFDVMTSMTRMIFSGVFDRYPRLKMVLPFAGAGIMSLLGRLDYSYRAGFAALPTEDAKMPRHLPSAYIGTNVYVELGLSFSPTTVEQAVKIFGSDHVLFGTDYPAVAAVEEQIAIIKQLDLNQTDTQQILWQNANNLFHLNVVNEEEGDVYGYS